MIVRIDYRDRDLTSYLADAQDKIGKNVHFDSNKYRIEWGGQFENQRRAQARLILIFGIVLSLMALFLYMGFGKLRQALLILSVVPLATLGGLIALHLRGETLNVATRCWIHSAVWHGARHWNRQRRPAGLGTVVVGGLIVATVLTLFILPTLYFVMEHLVARRFPMAAHAEAPEE